MKRFIVSLIMNVFLFSLVKSEIPKSLEEIKLEVKILERISKDISKKSKINVFVIGYKTAYLKKYSKSFVLVDDCSKANIIIAKKNDKLLLKECPSNIPGIALKYSLLKNNDIFIGALFWYKGRPNLVFIKYRLKKFKIKLPGSYKKYIEDEIW